MLYSFLVVDTYYVSLGVSLQRDMWCYISNLHRYADMHN